MRVTFLQSLPISCFAMSLDFQNQSHDFPSDAPADGTATLGSQTPCASPAESEASVPRDLPLEEHPTDAELLIEVTGLPGETQATCSDVARLVHNLRQREARPDQILWLLELLEGAHDRLHPGPMLANPFVLIRISLTVGHRPRRETQRYCARQGGAKSAR